MKQAATVVVVAVIAVVVVVTIVIIIDRSTTYSDVSLGCFISLVKILFFPFFLV